MRALVTIAVRVSFEDRAALIALAGREQTTVAALMRRVIERTVHPYVGDSALEQAASGRRARSGRVNLRLVEEDSRLLEARAQARSLPMATYAATLLRAHLRSLTPLPTEEVRTLKRLISELAAIGRNLNQIARAANQGQPVRLTRDDLMSLLRVCEGLRKEIKALVHANVLSWELGHATTDR